MRLFVYTCLLHKFNVTYLGTVISVDGRVTIYGYNKRAGQYSFWDVVNHFSLRLIEVCESKTKAMFLYKVLSKGV